MPDSLDLETLTAAATEAASRGDAVAAASLLRLALDQQVSALGPDHHDLAPTLNNLAMMLERQGENAEAERCYRRAYDVARRSAPADDPLVKVSRANLVAFLQAAGVADPVVDLPVEDRAPAGAPPAPMTGTGESGSPLPVAPPTRSAAAPSAPVRAPERTVAAPAASASPRQAPAPAPASAAATGLNRRGRFAVAIIAGAMAGGLAGWLLIGGQAPDREGERPQAVAPAAVAPVAPPASPTKQPPPVEADRTPEPPPPAPATPAPSETAASPPKAPVPAPFPSPRPRSPEAASRGRSEGAAISVEGRVCTALVRNSGVWRCDPAGETTSSGAVYYYSRVRSPRDIVVRHRWSHQGTVTQTVPLEVRANPQQGYRTFSRQNLAGRSGNWEVSLLGPDGTVVETQRFTVR